MAGAPLGSSGHKAGTLPAQDALPSQGHSDPPALTPTGTQQSPTVYIFGVWEETGVPRENPCKNGENLPTPHSGSGWGLIFYFLINVVMK